MIGVMGTSHEAYDQHASVKLFSHVQLEAQCSSQAASLWLLWASWQHGWTTVDSAFSGACWPLPARSQAAKAALQPMESTLSISRSRLSALCHCCTKAKASMRLL